MTTTIQIDLRSMRDTHEEGSAEHVTLDNAIKKLEYFEDWMCDIEDRITFMNVIDERQDELHNEEGS